MQPAVLLKLAEARLRAARLFFNTFASKSMLGDSKNTFSSAWVGVNSVGRSVAFGMCGMVQCVLRWSRFIY